MGIRNRMRRQHDGKLRSKSGDIPAGNLKMGHVECSGIRHFFPSPSLQLVTPRRVSSAPLFKRNPVASDIASGVASHAPLLLLSQRTIAQRPSLAISNGCPTHSRRNSPHAADVLLPYTRAARVRYPETAAASAAVSAVAEQAENAMRPSVKSR